MLNQSLLPEFDQEMKTTRRVLERVPDGKLEFKPHAKSMSMGQLASHVAEMVGWATATIQTDTLDVNPPGGQRWVPFVAKSNAELLAAFDQKVETARAAIAGASDANLMAQWSLLSGGNPIFTMPRVATLRGMIFNHIIHHRGQLSVYLRLNDIPVPSIYGPSADEGTM
jgi:uncharacterized damage-inducible protein DinB